MSKKLLIIMIDGISADYFATCRDRLPHLDALAERGTVVNNLHAEVLGTSLPGRASMMTGFPADVSGVYGNMIWDGERFRYVNPDDVRVPTLPARAKAAGLSAAVIGFAMIRPEDATIFKAPWWVSEFIERARDARPLPSDLSWLRVFHHQDSGAYFNRVCIEAGYPDSWHPMNVGNKWMMGMIADHYALTWTGLLAASPNPPDLIITEFLTTDTIQHETGYKSELSHWAIAQADAMVGAVVERLRSANVLDEWNIAVMSDHGHSEIETAIHPQVIIPGTIMQSEGSILMTIPKDESHRQHITEALARYGVEPYPSYFVPEEFRKQVASFAAPPKTSFEHDDPDETEPLGRPAMMSSHGLRPGLPGDDRFAVFAGPNIPRRMVETADAVQVAPTFARILGLPLHDFPAQPIFEPASSVGAR